MKNFLSTDFPTSFGLIWNHLDSFIFAEMTIAPSPVCDMGIINSTSLFFTKEVLQWSSQWKFQWKTMKVPMKNTFVLEMV